MRILVVDDEPFCLTLTYKFLKEKNHTVVTASQADEALQIMESMDFDLVITDILMPNTPGTDLIRHIKESDKPIPVLAMTAGFENAQEDYMNEAEMFADAAIKKPLHKDQFLEIVETLGEA